MGTLQPDRVIINPQFAESDIFKILETMHSDFRLRQIQITMLAGIDITEKQAATVNDFNSLVFSRQNLEEVPFFKAIQSSVRK
jgi:hypothetical protein